MALEKVYPESHGCRNHPDGCQGCNTGEDQRNNSNSQTAGIARHNREHDYRRCNRGDRDHSVYSRRKRQVFRAADKKELPGGPSGDRRYFRGAGKGKKEDPVKFFKENEGRYSECSIASSYQVRIPKEMETDGDDVAPDKETFLKQGSRKCTKPTEGDVITDSIQKVNPVSNKILTAKNLPGKRSLQD